LKKPDKSKVHPGMARKALEMASGDRQLAYTKYILLHYRSTGRLLPGCDSRDLHAFYEKEGE